MNKLLYYITGHLPCKVISDNGVPYLERYYLFSMSGIRFYIHRFVGSDPDRGLHNHPWRWAISFILSGFYMEQTHYGVKPVRWINGLVGDSFHRVILPENQKFVWTLFFHKEDRVKSWGFLREDENGIHFIPHNFKANQVGQKDEWWLTAPKGKETKERYIG